MKALITVVFAALAATLFFTAERLLGVQKDFACSQEANKILATVLYSPGAKLEQGQAPNGDIVLVLSQDGGQITLIFSAQCRERSKDW